MSFSFKEELLSRRFDFFVHPEDVEKSEIELEKITYGLNLMHFENRCITKSGRIVWLSWHCHAINEEGIITYAEVLENAGDLPDFDKIKANPNFSIIGHIVEEKEGNHLITRANTKIPLKARGWNAMTE